MEEKYRWILLFWTIAVIIMMLLIFQNFGNKENIENPQYKEAYDKGFKQGVNYVLEQKRMDSTVFAKLYIDTMSEEAKMWRHKILWSTYIPTELHIHGIDTTLNINIDTCGGNAR